MRQLFAWQASRLSWLLLLLCPAALLALEPLFQLPASVSAQRFRYDYPATSGDAVLVDFALNDQGEPRDLRVRHGQSPFREVVENSLLPDWTFALPQDAPKEARVAATALFRQPQLVVVKPGRYELPGIYTDPSAPPQPRVIVEPQHPPNVNTDGLAVLGVSVSEGGVVTQATPLFGAQSFLRQTRSALEDWEFEPARQEGQPVAGGLLVIVYFPRPAL